MAAISAMTPGAARRAARHRVTLRQVAEHAAVSRQTVSNALNAPHRLDPATLARVIKAVEELRYRPNRSARSLSTGNAGLIGYCLARRSDGSANAIMDEFLHALCGVAEAAGRHVLLFTAPPGPPGLTVYADLVAQQAVDGFVLSETEQDDPRHRWLAERGIRFASFGRTWPTVGPEPGPWVDVDGAAACAELVAGLHTLGHDRIGFVGWCGPFGAAGDREQGWRSTCLRLGLPAGDDLLARCTQHTVQEGERAALTLLDSRNPPTAIMAVSDVLAFGVQRGAAARGRTPGIDLAVTGFDDSPLAAAVTPALTSVAQPLAEIAATLLHQLQNPAGDTGGVLLPGTIVSRTSAPLGAPPAAAIPPEPGTEGSCGHGS